MRPDHRDGERLMNILFWRRKKPSPSPWRVNLGGEGEVTGTLNHQGPWIDDLEWRSCRDGKTLLQLLAEGHRFVRSPNSELCFPSASVAEVITNNVPIDLVTWLGPGIPTAEVERILQTKGRWWNNGTLWYVKP